MNMMNFKCHEKEETDTYPVFNKWTADLFAGFVDGFSFFLSFFLQLLAFLIFDYN